MELQKKFNVILHNEAHEFLASLDEKTRKKIFQTFDRASLLLDLKYSKSWQILISGSSARFSIKRNIEYWHFGIRKDLLIL